jgi:hypothetical protein
LSIFRAKGQSTDLLHAFSWHDNEQSIIDCRSMSPTRFSLFIRSDDDDDDDDDDLGLLSLPIILVLQKR